MLGWFIVTTGKKGVKALGWFIISSKSDCDLMTGKVPGWHLVTAGEKNVIP